MLARCWWKLTVAAGATVTAASIGSRFRPGEWYQNLTKPPFTPPDFVFPLVWSALYALMAVAAWLVWTVPASRLRNVGLSLFFFQLGANAAWSWLFFGCHAIGWALLNLGLLLVVVGACVAVFARLKSLSAYLMVPYLLWTGFAGILNFWIWLFNG